jgi:hypothetical protein
LNWFLLKWSGCIYADVAILDKVGTKIFFTCCGFFVRHLVFCEKLKGCNVWN